MRTRLFAGIMLLGLGAVALAVGCGSSGAAGDAGATDAATADTTTGSADAAEAGSDVQLVDSGLDVTVSDAKDAGDAAEASEDANASADAYVAPAIYGIWQGTQGSDSQGTWSVIVGVIDRVADAAPGTVVGVITYPSLGCGGPLSVLGPDAGADDEAGLVDDRDGGDASVVSRLVFYETDNQSCVNGNDYFSLLSDGTLRLEWSAPANPRAVGYLTRAGTAGPAEPLVAVWAEPTVDSTGLHPLLAAVTRTNAVGQGAGVFLLRGGTPGAACGGLWTLSSRASATELGLTESFPQQQVGCQGTYAVSLVAVDGGALYTRPNGGGDGGGEAGPQVLGDGGPLTLLKIGD